MEYPKLYHPDHPQNGHPDPRARKTLTPSNQQEYEGLLRIGWKVAPDDFLKEVKA
jgi:hypothetical protein